MGLTTTALILGVITYALWSLKGLITNVQIARRTGLRVVVLPMHTISIPYLITMPLYKPLTLLLPFGLSESKYLRFFWRDWAFQTRDTQFEEYGDMFMISTPSGNILQLGDANVTEQVLRRKDDFPKDIKFYEWVMMFGDSVLTTEGSKWRQHRKITSPPFSEAVNSTVWKNTLVQTTSLIAAWTSTSSVKIHRDIRSIARNIISAAGFGVSIPFHSAHTTDPAPSTDDPLFGTTAPPNHTLPYGEALDYLLDNLIFAFISPRWLQRIGPASWRKTAVSYADTGLYLSEMLAREKEHPTTSGVHKNLLAALIATSTSASHKDQLCHDDLIGNIFVFAVAGLETTAGTLEYALAELAIRPDLQEWMWADLDAALAGESENPSEWGYETVWPKLIAVLCIIYETLRQHPTFQSLPKWTADMPQTVQYRNKDVTIPANTSILVTLVSLHYKKAYWGPDADTFNPRAWDVREPAVKGWGTDEAAIGGAPFSELRVPVKGSYIPFMEGWRSCLGRKFALVEMVAVLAVLFRKHGCRAKRREGETQEEADKRVRAVMNASSSVVSVTMNQEVELVWERRKGV